jgi:predicted alpha/beta-fold hydrolase
MEEPLFFESDGSRLFGVLHLPAASESRGTRHAARMGLVFCPPFAEEHKQGYRVFVELARRLEREGFACLRFDYRGTGDSEGPFTDFSLAGARRDIAGAVAFLRERAGVERIGLIGLRLGASLALQSAECGVRSAERDPASEHDSDGTRHAARGTLQPSCLVLWQPIVDGALFYRLNLRRMLVRQMMTHGKASGERDTGRAGTIATRSKP